MSSRSSDDQALEAAKAIVLAKLNALGVRYDPAQGYAVTAIESPGPVSAETLFAALGPVSAADTPRIVQFDPKLMEYLAESDDVSWLKISIMWDLWFGGSGGATLVVGTGPLAGHVSVRRPASQGNTPSVPAYTMLLAVLRALIKNCLNVGA